MTVASKIRTLPAAALGLAAGASLLFLGVPATIDAFLSIPANSVLLKLQNGEPVSKEEISLVIDSKRRSLSWLEDGRKWADLAAAQLLLAEQMGDDESGQDLNSEARRSLKIGLGLAPADAFAWTRFAYADFLISGPSAPVATALQMAILTAPYNPRLLFLRLQLCFVVWPHFMPTDRDLVYQQVRFAWKDDPKRLVTIAWDLHQIGLVRTALSTLPGEEARFSILLRQPSS